MRKWICSVCGYIYDETKEKILFENLPQDWTCPQCGAPKIAFNIVEVILAPEHLHPICQTHLAPV